MSEMGVMRAPHLVRGDQARERILAAAAVAFAHKGFNGSSLDKIAQAARMTKPGLLHHFPSKLELLRAVLDQREAEAILVAGSDTETLEVLTSLLSVARRDVADAVRTRGYAVLLGEAAALESPVAFRFREHHDRVVAEIATAIRSAADAGMARADVDPEAIAAEALAIMDGLQSQWLLGGEPETYLDRLEGYLTRLRAYLEAGAATA